MHRSSFSAVVSLSWRQRPSYLVDASTTADASRRRSDVFRVLERRILRFA